MPSILNLVVRDGKPTESDSDGLNPMMVNLLIAFLVLLLVALVLTGILMLLRSRRRSRKEAGLPLYNENASSSNRHRLTISTSRNPQSIHVYNEKQNLMENSSSPPMSPDAIPEIRITFPEEEDESGKRKSGRVVVVHVGETGVGLGPMEENLPPYSKSDSQRFHSVDMERIGGLKESFSATRI